MKTIEGSILALALFFAASVLTGATSDDMNILGKWALVIDGEFYARYEFYEDGDISIYGFSDQYGYSRSYTSPDLSYSWKDLENTSELYANGVPAGEFTYDSDNDTYVSENTELIRVSGQQSKELVGKWYYNFELSRFLTFLTEGMEMPDDVEGSGWYSIELLSDGTFIERNYDEDKQPDGYLNIGLWLDNGEDLITLFYAEKPYIHYEYSFKDNYLTITDGEDRIHVFERSKDRPDNWLNKIVGKWIVSKSFYGNTWEISPDGDFMIDFTDFNETGTWTLLEGERILVDFEADDEALLLSFRPYNDTLEVVDLFYGQVFELIKIVEHTEYTVKTGDSLASIAQRFYGDMEKWEYIKQYNSLSEDRLTVGQILLIPVTFNDSAENSEDSAVHEMEFIGKWTNDFYNYMETYYDPLWWDVDDEEFMELVSYYFIESACVLNVFEDGTYEIISACPYRYYTRYINEAWRGEYNPLDILTELYEMGFEKTENEHYGAKIIDDGAYIGFIENDMANGYGYYVYEDLAVYYGLLVDDIPQGFGIIFYEDNEDGIRQISGYFEDGLLSGDIYCMLDDEEGTRVVGFYEEGELVPGMVQASEGKHEYAMFRVDGLNAALYRGEVLYGTQIPDGYGLLIDFQANGNSHLGLFENGVPNGPGIQFTGGDVPNFFYGIWENGRLDEIISGTELDPDNIEVLTWPNLNPFNENKLTMPKIPQIMLPRQTTTPTETPMPR